MPKPRARTLQVLTLVAILGLGSSSTLATEASDGEFGGECVMGLALGKDIQTDCSVSTVYKGKTYCFGNEKAKSLFLKRPDDFLLQAQIYYNSKKDAEKSSSKE